MHKKGIDVKISSLKRILTSKYFHLKAKNTRLFFLKKVPTQKKGTYTNSRGVAILIKNSVDCTIRKNKILEPLGRYIIVKADKMYVLINVYAPNKDKEIAAFFKNLSRCKKRQVIVIAHSIPLSTRKVALLLNENLPHTVLIVFKENLI